MARPVLTEALARAAAKDAGNRSMRAGGRKVWSRTDYDAAVHAFDRLIPQIADAEARFRLGGENPRRRRGASRATRQRRAVEPGARLFAELHRRYLAAGMGAKDVAARLAWLRGQVKGSNPPLLVENMGPYVYLRHGGVAAWLNPERAQIVAVARFGKGTKDAELMAEASEYDRMKLKAALTREGWTVASIFTEGREVAEAMLERGRWHGPNPLLAIAGNPPVKLLTAALRRTLPKLHATEGQADPLVRVKFFNPTGAGTWLAIEFDGADTFYGWATLGDPQNAELGYFSLGELQAFRGRFGLGIERDLSFTPAPLSAAVRAANPAGAWGPGRAEQSRGPFATVKALQAAARELLTRVQADSVMASAARLALASPDVVMARPTLQADLLDMLARYTGARTRRKPTPAPELLPVTAALLRGRGRNPGPVTVYGEPIRTRTAQQEWYDAASGHARQRAAQLRALGFKVSSETSAQVTPVGRLRMTLLTVHYPGDREIPPPERIEARGQNPGGAKPRGRTFGRQVEELKYQHVSEGPRVHTFDKPGTRLEALRDGSVRIFNPSAPVWAEEH